MGHLINVEFAMGPYRWPSYHRRYKILVGIFFVTAAFNRTVNFIQFRNLVKLMRREKE